MIMCAAGDRQLHLFAPRLEIVLDDTKQARFQRRSSKPLKLFVVMVDTLSSDYVCAVVDGATNYAELATLLGHFDNLHKQENGSCVHVYDHWADGFQLHPCRCFPGLLQLPSPCPRRCERLTHGYQLLVPANSKTTTPQWLLDMEEACPFEPAATFDGKREGWVYKCGVQGIGYYTDLVVAPHLPVMTFVEWLNTTALCPLAEVDGETALIIAWTEANAFREWPLLLSDATANRRFEAEPPIVLTGLTHTDTLKRAQLHIIGDYFSLYRGEELLFRDGVDTAARRALHERMRAVIGTATCFMTVRRQLEQAFAGFEKVFQLAPWKAWCTRMLVAHLNRFNNDVRKKAKSEERHRQYKKLKTKVVQDVSDHLKHATKKGWFVQDDIEL